MLKPYYEQNGMTIYHGDCLDILPTLDVGSIDLLLTDPPYGISYSPGGGGKGLGKKTFTGKDIVTGDNQPFNPTPLLVFKRAIMFGANHYAHLLPPSPTWIVWDKREGMSTNDFADCELIWSNVGGPARLFHHLWSGMMKASEKGVRRVHPTQKPVALMSWLLELYSKPGDMILDPYLGSGTTLVAAKMLGRCGIGIEIEEKYCEIAARRLDQGVLPLETVVTEQQEQQMSLVGG